jgi:hypothetical protein
MTKCFGLPVNRSKNMPAGILHFYIGIGDLAIDTPVPTAEERVRISTMLIAAGAMSD